MKHISLHLTSSTVVKIVKKMHNFPPSFLSAYQFYLIELILYAVASLPRN